MRRFGTAVLMSTLMAGLVLVAPMPGRSIEVARATSASDTIGPRQRVFCRYVVVLTWQLHRRRPEADPGK